MTDRYRRMAAPNDTRILTADELEAYAKDYHALEDLSHYDFSSLDFDSDYFRSLPIAEQYSILNAARLRSRLRMGYSKEQLDDMFPDRLTFSRFQIQRLKERNDYTQRLMNLNGMNDVGPQRIAGEKGREYFLVRNEGAEGGWVLGTADVGGAKEKPVLVDVEHKSEDEEDADDEFEDVPLENTQPEEPPLLKSIPQLARKSQPTGYGIQTKLPFTPTKKADEALFVIDDDDMDELGQEGFVGSDDDAELQTAINISMQQTDSPISAKSPVLPSVDSLQQSTIYDAELEEALALSLSQDDRPMTSSSNNTDFQTALALSREDANLQKTIDLTGLTDQSDFESVDLYERFPLSAKDKGKGVATSPTPEIHVSTQDEELSRAIELSKTDFAGYNHVDGVGPSTSFGTVENSPSRILGRSMFRKKQQPVPQELTEKSTQEVPTRDQEVLEIAEEPASDVVLEEKMQQASPVPIPTKRPEVRKEIAEPVQVMDDIEPISSTNLPDSPRRETLSPEPQLHRTDGEKITPATPDERPISRDSQNLSESQLSNTLESAHEPQEELDLISDDEDEELMAQLAAEAEEHARFASSINPAASARADDYSYDTLRTDLTEEDFEKEMRSLRNQQKKDRRDADEVNQLMVVECQQLLRLFGLPYITAPMEAEAQCAELVSLGLVDGIVTDDSDIFLFGGTRVFKNMFSQGKFVECYLQSELERDFNLDRQKFINLAHLLGSDYAEGIPHVGPVNALELLSDFPGEKGLEEFRDWWIAVQQGRLPKSPTETEFRRKFRKNLTKIFLPNDFPNRVIDQAYLKPEVDSDPQAFVWGVPDLDALRSFLMSQIGWSKERTDEILVPIIKDMNRRQV
jgi:DNA excision repair protein ERCC-5